ncbi:coronin, putative [Plasmodium gallinaceum]|uniref:Coronin n=1 Tax=Plasmodium gallinaceum TaxID=5849 RepID=A0A1J1H1F4_PLAGA|nr:coronin, putative [Plasmodium gallinaceum]CRG97141.1 coronin, putative [Plasmodium gallinaceum]
MNNTPHIKNLYSEPSNKLFGDLRICTRATESCGIACSTVYLATPWEVEGGGMLGVIRLKDQIKNPPVIKMKGHTANILDLSFNPCYSKIIASSSEDLTVRIWELPYEDENITEITNPACILKGHKKKVSIIDWNPMSYYILASTAFDSFLNIWDIENEKKAFQINMPKKLTSLKWNIRGNLLSGACLNKNLHIIDPRKKEICFSFGVHNGGKSVKSTWIDGLCGDDNCVLSTGFSKDNMREIKLWDLKNTSTPLTSISLDNASAPLLPFYDETLGIVYLIGKGDGNCRYYQYLQGNIHKVEEYKSNLPFRSFGFLPKQMCDIYKCELGRVYKNENNNSIRPISFIVPRKNSSVFQKDLYPPIIVHDPEYDSKNWVDGVDLDIKRIGINELTNDDLKITKKFKSIPQSFKSIIIQDPIAPKKSSIIRQFTKRLTFFKKNNEHDNSLESLNGDIIICNNSFKEDEISKIEKDNKFYYEEYEKNKKYIKYLENTINNLKKQIKNKEDSTKTNERGNKIKDNLNKFFDNVTHMKLCKKRNKFLNEDNETWSQNEVEETKEYEQLEQCTYENKEIAE